GHVQLRPRRAARDHRAGQARGAQGQLLGVNFFARQDQARRQSRRLVILFALAVAAIVVAVDLVFLLFFGGMGTATDPGALVLGLAMASLLTLGIIGIGSMYRLASLRQGGAAVATGLGGT